MYQYAQFNTVKSRGKNTLDARSTLTARRIRICAAVGFFGWPGIVAVGGGGAERSNAFSVRWTQAGIAGSISDVLFLWSRLPFCKAGKVIKFHRLVTLTSRHSCCWYAPVYIILPCWTCCVGCASWDRTAFPFCFVPERWAQHSDPASRQAQC